MRAQKINGTKQQVRQRRQRCERFAAGAAEAIGGASHCLFSLLPYQERHRNAADWYEACAQAMLRGNYAPLDEWIRRQACKAAEERFELEDLLQLLRICRRSAITIDGWDEDVFSGVDEVINEGLLAMRPNVLWNISDDLNYLKEAKTVPALHPESYASEPIPCAQIREGERRESGRNRLALPIRVCGTGEHGQAGEITSTENVSLTGLYFKTQETYRIGSKLRITYPYWTDPGSINREYSARVARLDRFSEQTWGVAVEFLQNLRDKTNY